MIVHSEISLLVIPGQEAQTVLNTVLEIRWQGAGLQAERQSHAVQAKDGEPKDRAGVQEPEYAVVLEVVLGPGDELERPGDPMLQVRRVAELGAYVVNFGGAGKEAIDDHFEA